MVTRTRAKILLERLHLVERQINFETAALFLSPIRWVKKCGNFKTNLFFDQKVSFLYYLCSEITFIEIISGNGSIFKTLVWYRKRKVVDRQLML